MAIPEENAADQFVRIFKEQIFPSLVNGISDELFRPGREEELRSRIAEIIDTHLNKDEIPVGKSLRAHIIDTIMADISRAKT